MPLEAFHPIDILSLHTAEASWVLPARCYAPEEGAEACAKPGRLLHILGLSKLEEAATSTKFRGRIVGQGEREFSAAMDPDARKAV